MLDEKIMLEKVKLLKSGQVFRNYRELCRFLEVEPKGGKSRDLHLERELSRYFKYTRKDNEHKITIDEIYLEPLPKVSNRGKSKGSRNNYRGIYAEYIDILLLQYLSSQGMYVETTNNTIAENCGIVNSNYRVANEHQGKFYNAVKTELNLEYNLFCMIDTFQNIKAIIRDTIRNSMNRLTRIKQLEYDYLYFIYALNSSRKANDDELEFILESERLTMEEMNIQERRKIDNNYKLSREFSKKVREKVNQKYNYIKNIYRGYAITLLEDVTPKENTEIEELKIKLNELVIKSLMEKAQNEHNKVVEKDGIKGYIGARNTFWKKWDYDRVSELYVQRCFDIIYILCNLQAERKIEQIRGCKNEEFPSFFTHKEKEDNSKEDDLINKLLEDIDG